MLVKDMDISWLMIYVERNEGEKLKEGKQRESKRVQFEGGFSNARFGGGNGCPNKAKSSNVKDWFRL